jgi:hypothetical protein
VGLTRKSLPELLLWITKAAAVTFGVLILRAAW